MEEATFDLSQAKTKSLRLFLDLSLLVWNSKIGVGRLVRIPRKTVLGQEGSDEIGRLGKCLDQRVLKRLGWNA